MPTGETARNEQLNIRLTASYADILDAVAFRDEKKPAAVARDVLQAFLDRECSDPLVEELLRIRAERKARAEGKVSDLKPKKRSGA